MLFGWKQRPPWRDQGLSALLEAFLEPVWGEVFPTQSHTIKQPGPRLPRVTPLGPSQGGWTRQDQLGCSSSLAQGCRILKPFSFRGLTVDTPSAPVGAHHLPSAGCACRVVDRTQGTLLCSPVASWRLESSLGAEGSQRWAGAMAGGAQGRSRASGEEEEALQFGLVFAESALAPRVERPRLAPAPALGCHRRPRWRWAGRHLAALPGPGGAGLLVAPRTARPSGWASAELPGYLGCKAGGGRARSSTPRVLH